MYSGEFDPFQPAKNLLKSGAKITDTMNFKLNVYLNGNTTYFLVLIKFHPHPTPPMTLTISKRAALKAILNASWTLGIINTSKCYGLIRN